VKDSRSGGIQLGQKNRIGRAAEVIGGGGAGAGGKRIIFKKKKPSLA